jgi:hypothetical protein
MRPVPIFLITALVLPACSGPVPRPQATASANPEPARPPEGAAEETIPPEDRWTSRTYDPPSRPGGLDSDGPNIRVNQDSSGRDQNETVITVSPTNPLNLVGGANDYRSGDVQCGWYSSRDGGLTWTDGVFGGTPYPRQGDPTVAFCADGSVVYVCLSFTGSFQAHGLYSFRSEDGGLLWQGPYTILDRPNGFPFADKEWVACDRSSSPFANRAYTTWTDFGAQTAILLSRSADGGESWSGGVRVSDAGSPQGSVIAITPDGAVNVAWYDSSGGGRVGFDRSTNGGGSFGPDLYPSSVDAIPADPVFRRNSFPSMDADLSGGAHDGNLYIVWADDRHGDPDILLVRSTDQGATWSDPIVVNDDPPGTGADQWFPWLAVDPRGRVAVTFFDRRRSPGGRRYEIWGAISRDGGLNFDTNFLVSDTASNGSLNGFIGDYGGLAATEDHLHPLWTDLRAGTGETDAYTDRFPNTFDYDEVTGLRFTDDDTLEFDPLDGRFGVDLDYDVVSGLLGELRGDGGFARATCAAPAWPAPPYVDARVPPAGEVIYFLVRSRGPAGVGTYGDGTAARPNVRDPLDEASPCP